MQRATVLCPGASLRTFSSSDLLDGPVVAVTDGLFADLPITHWCYQEPPREVGGSRYKAYYPRLEELQPVIWTGKSMGPTWEPWGLSVQIVDDKRMEDLARELGWDELVMVDHCIRNRGKSDGTVLVENMRGSMLRCSVFYAIARCLVEGAEEVKIIGSDMDGHANYHPKTGEPLVHQQHPRYWETRWREEREIMKLMISKAEGIGRSVWRA